MAKILVIEDESSIREIEVAYLKQAGFEVDEVEDGKQALLKISEKKYDLLVLDLNLPEVDGLQVCKTVRETSNVPIVMVTAKVEEIEELIGLESGADDYVKKPFSPAILVARVKKCLERVGENKLEIFDLTIDPERMEVIQSGKVIEMTTTQFNILYTLANNPGKVFTRDEILDRAYDGTLPPDILDRTVDAHIKTIRKKLDDKDKYILTVIGRGYKFAE